MDEGPFPTRELHWHPEANEWQYHLAGEARMTVFDATAKARTFNCRAGDVGFVPRCGASAGRWCAESADRSSGERRSDVGPVPRNPGLRK